MPRANRYVLSGETYHVTHRCHDRSFLLRFARDRDEYRRRLREGLRGSEVTMLDYTVTSNHVHLLLRAVEKNAVSELMQRVAGEFAKGYNRRKKRSGAFWEGRYHCTMVDGDAYLWRCLRYIDLNMVRAGAVGHPREWEWCGFREVVCAKKRYRLVDQDGLCAVLGCTDLSTLRAAYMSWVEEGLAMYDQGREPAWTEAIAVGSQKYVRRMERLLESRTGRVELAVEQVEVHGGEGELWVAREPLTPYGPKRGPEIAAKPLQEA